MSFELRFHRAQRIAQAQALSAQRTAGLAQKLREQRTKRTPMPTALKPSDFGTPQGHPEGIFSDFGRTLPGGAKGVGIRREDTGDALGSYAPDTDTITLFKNRIEEVARGMGVDPKVVEDQTLRHEFAHANQTVLYKDKRNQAGRPDDAHEGVFLYLNNRLGGLPHPVPAPPVSSFGTQGTPEGRFSDRLRRPVASDFGTPQGRPEGQFNDKLRDRNPLDELDVMTRAQPDRPLPQGSRGRRIAEEVERYLNGPEGQALDDDTKGYLGDLSRRGIEGAAASAVEAPFIRKPFGIPIELGLAETAALGVTAPVSGVGGIIGAPLGVSSAQVATGERPPSAIPLDLATSIATAGVLKGGSKLIGAGVRGVARGTSEAAALRGGFVAEGGGTKLGTEIEEGFVRGLPAEAPQVPEIPSLQIAVRKLTDAFKAAPRLRAAQEAARTTERSQRLGGALNQFERGLEPEEAFAAARGQLGGELPFAEFTAGRDLLSPDEARSLWQAAADYKPPEGFGFRKIRLGEAVRKIMVDGKLPQENEIKLFRQVFGDELAEVIEKQAAEGQGAWELFLDSTGVPKAFLSSFDVSFMGRQGIMTFPRHPIIASKTFIESARSFFSDERAALVRKSIEDDATPFTVARADGTSAAVPFGEILAERMPGVLRELEAPVSERQQRILKRWLGGIPGIAQSQRAYVTAGNKLRADIIKSRLLELQARGATLSEKRLRSIGNFHLRLTGQGTLGEARGKLVEGVAALGWSPFYRLAPIQTIASLFHPDAVIRRMAAEEVVTFFGTGVALLGGIKASGIADVEVDPRSSDFGKIKIGNQRINFWGTSQLLARSLAQIATGERKSLDTGLVFPKAVRNTIETYFRSGLAPEWSLIIDALDGKTVIGREIDFSSLQGIGRESFERLVPLAIQDVIEASSKQGAAAGIRSGALSPIGIGVQTFGSSPRIKLSDGAKKKITDEQLAWVEDLLYYTELERAKLREEGFDTERIKFEKSIRLYGSKLGADLEIIEWAILLRSGTKTRGVLTEKND